MNFLKKRWKNFVIRMLRLKEVIKGEVVKEQVKKRVEIQKQGKSDCRIFYFGTCSIKCGPHLFPQLFLNIQNQQHTTLFTY